MTFTETTTTWYWTRIWNSIKRVFFWILFIIASSILLWWNEWKSVDIEKSLNEWQKITIKVDSNSINKSLEWKLVYVNWEIKGQNILKDNLSNIESKAIKLERKVEMYQWIEHKNTKHHDNTWWSHTTTNTYTYNTKWSDKIENSNSYKEIWHENPNIIKFWSASYINNNKIWIYNISEEFIKKLNTDTNIQLIQKDVNKFKILNKEKNAQLEWNYIYLWTWSSINPNIWDIRISYNEISEWEYSLVWKQEWDSIKNYTSSNWNDITLIEKWNVSIENIFTKAKNDNKTMTWIIRWVGLFLMFAWFTMIFWLITDILMILPFFANIVWFWAFLLSIILTTILWWWIIIIARIFVRPLLSISLVVWIILITLWIIRLKQNK